MHTREDLEALVCVLIALEPGMTISTRNQYEWVNTGVSNDECSLGMRELRAELVGRGFSLCAVPQQVDSRASMVRFYTLSVNFT